MGYESYYDVAKNDLAFLDYSMQAVDGAPAFNNFLVQEQQICEKMLKELVHRFVFTSDVQNILKSHKLITLVNAIQKYTEWDLQLDIGKLRILSDFYFDGRYPSIDYLVATKDDALDGYETTKSVVQAVEKMIVEYKPKMKKIDVF